MTGKTLEENLRQIEEALTRDCSRCGWENLSSIQGLQALASLRTLLTGDGEADRKIVQKLLDDARDELVGDERWIPANDALKRLSAKLELMGKQLEAFLPGGAVERGLQLLNAFLRSGTIFTVGVSPEVYDLLAGCIAELEALLPKKESEAKDE